MTSKNFNAKLYKKEQKPYDYLSPLNETTYLTRQNFTIYTQVGHFFKLVSLEQGLSYCPVLARSGQRWNCNPLTGAGSNPLGASCVEDLTILLTRNTLNYKHTR